MKTKILRKTLIAFTAVCAIGAAACLSACSSGGGIKTRHPTAQITISFNDEDYTLKYKLYRNMYPVTVQHFIELANAGFYDNMIVHDYETNDWKTGGYAYYSDEEAEKRDSVEPYSDGYKDASYYESISKEEEYYKIVRDGYDDKTFTPSVWRDGEANYTRDNALCTLIGEFENNGHNIKNGALSGEFGSLRMYYTDKTSTSFVTVKNGKDEYLSLDYKYNSATSLFAIQTGTASSLPTEDYCIFAVLKNSKSEDKLNELMDDIADYIDDTYDESDEFTESVGDVHVDNLEELSTDDQGQTDTFRTTAVPIIIREVRITKY
ncbi:MAG: peptidylprolyl isomerase [Clostridia bacterium]|nr:peptidylprolyl isomerase [Clostridia bacterium]